MFCSKLELNAILGLELGFLHYYITSQSALDHVYKSHNPTGTTVPHSHNPSSPSRHKHRTLARQMDPSLGEVTDEEEEVVRATMVPPIAQANMTHREAGRAPTVTGYSPEYRHWLSDMILATRDAKDMQ